MRKKRIFMVVENNFPDDPRVRREAYSLKEKFDITILALRKKGERSRQNINGIEVIRIPTFPDLRIGMLTYAAQYFYITLAAVLVFLVTYPVRFYRFIHIHNPPDTLFVLGVVGKIMGAKLIYDLHDLSPELYLSRISPNKGALYRILRLAEKLSCKWADVVITTNNSYKERVQCWHGIPSEKIFIVRNDPSIDETEEGAAESDSNRSNLLNLVFVGAINPQDGLDVLVEIIRILVEDRGRRDFICRILGEGDSLAHIEGLVKEKNLGDYVHFAGFVSGREKVKQHLHQADIGLEPAPDNPVNRLSTFIKVMEYMASGIPLVAFDLAETRFSADGAALLVPPGDIEGFADSIIRLMDDSALRKELGSSGKERIRTELNLEAAAGKLHQAYWAIT